MTHSPSLREKSYRSVESAEERVSLSRSALPNLVEYILLLGESHR